MLGALRFYLQKIYDALVQCDVIYKTLSPHREPHKILLGRLQIYSDLLGLPDVAAQYKERLRSFSAASVSSEELGGATSSIPAGVELRRRHVGEPSGEDTERTPLRARSPSA